MIIARVCWLRATTEPQNFGTRTKGLLAGRQAFQFREFGALELKGIAEPVSACEVIYDRDQLRAFLSRTPFVGRSGEIARLKGRLAEVCSGQGGMVMLAGEPGIGKTRTAEGLPSPRVEKARRCSGDVAALLAPALESAEKLGMPVVASDRRELLTGRARDASWRRRSSVRNETPESGVAPSASGVG